MSADVWLQARDFAELGDCLDPFALLPEGEAEIIVCERISRPEQDRATAAISTASFMVLAASATSPWSFQRNREFDTNSRRVRAPPDQVSQDRNGLAEPTVRPESGSQLEDELRPEGSGHRVVPDRLVRARRRLLSETASQFVGEPWILQGAA